jgi:3-oxoacyl-[acyl-carrier protein] reductase
MAKKFNVDVRSTVCDLADPSQVSACVESVVSTWGRLNILVNNAGIAHFGRAHQISNDDWNRTIAVNLLAPIQLVRELLPTLAAQDEAHILNVCSILGLAPFQKSGAYQTSKFGLVGFTLALRSDYTRHGIGVTALCPGFVDTPLLANIEASRRVPALMRTSADKVARSALKAMRKNQALVVITPMAKMLWWLTRMLPGVMDRLRCGSWGRRGKMTAEELLPLEGDRRRAVKGVGVQLRLATHSLQSTGSPSIHETAGAGGEVPAAKPE